MKGAIEYEREIAKLRERLATTRASGGEKLLFTGIMMLAIMLFGWLGWDSYIAPAPPPDQTIEQHIHPDPVVSVYEKIDETYQYCVNRSGSRAERQNCYDSFEIARDRLITLIEQQKGETKGITHEMVETEASP